MGCIPFTRQSSGGKYFQRLKRVIGITRVIVIVLYALESKVAQLWFMGSRDFSYNVCGVVCYSVLLVLPGIAKEKWWQVRTNITATRVFVIPSSTSVA